jgi:Zn-finger nucleic acid-binding protein
METRFPCPVCLGVTMEKTPVRTASADHGGTLLLDHCPRCGGAWFEAGEVQRLRAGRPEELWAAIAPRREPYRMQCHSCETILDRDAATCPGCGWRNVLDCPVCQRPMKTATHADVRLDACGSCRGVWFDHAELEHVWRQEFAASLAKRRRGLTARSAAADGSLILLDALAWNPWLAIEGAHLAGHAVAAGAEVVAQAPEAIGAVAGAAGDAAAGVFETIVEIISGLFS